MTVRGLIYDSIVGDSILIGLGINDNSLFQGHGVDTPSVRPFAVIIFGINDPGPHPQSTTTLHRVTVWVHDQPAAYDRRINPIIKRIRAVISEIRGLSDGNGATIHQTRWLGDSEDLFDVERDTIVRTTSYTLVETE